MVNLKYSYAITYAILLLLISPPLFAKTDILKLTVVNKDLQLGKPIWIDIVTSKSSPSLQTLNFSSLQQEFEIINDPNQIRQTSSEQHWRIRLFPRKKGSLTIPALSFNNINSTPIHIQIGSPIDTKTGQSFDVEYQLSSSSPWVKQQVLVTYRITHQEPRLVLKPLTTHDDGTMLIALATKTQKHGDAFRHTTGWAIYPQRSGKRRIELPALHYIRDGVITHRFYPGTIHLDIKSIPTYLPGNIPVGKLKLTVQNNSILVITNHLKSMHLTLTGEGIPQQWLPDIQHLFKSSQQLQLYPVAKTSQQTASHNVVSQHTYQIPFKSLAQGSLTLPRLRLYYFDPELGKLASITLQHWSIFSISLWLLIPMTIIITALCLFTLLISFRWLMPRWQCLRMYYHALQSLPRQRTAQQFKNLVQRLSVAEGWSDNLSLRQWCHRQSVVSLASATQICVHLEPGLYRGENCDTKTLQGLFTQLCLLRWPILGWIHPI